MFDIGKEDLNYYYDTPGRLRSKDREVVDCFQRQMGNNSTVIDKRLKELESIAKERGYCALHIVCEPNGPYGHKFMRIAGRRGHATAYVSGESTTKMKF